MSVPRFLADEDLRFEIVLAARRIEPSIELPTVVEIGRSGATDRELLELAHGQRRIIVSHDVNTLKGEAETRIREGLGISGLLLAPQTRGTREVVESLLLIWSASEAEEWIDRIAYLPL